MTTFERSALARYRVLLVDDDPDTRDMTGVLLRAHGAELIAAESAHQALELVRTGQFDALIADIAMPGQNGYELLRAIRAFPPEDGGRIPAIAVTGYAGAGDRNKALSAGYDWHIAKPVDSTILVELIIGVILGRRMSRAD